VVSNHGDHSSPSLAPSGIERSHKIAVGAIVIGEIAVRKDGGIWKLGEKRAERPETALRYKPAPFRRRPPTKWLWPG
jgi:hypothetical protein